MQTLEKVETASFHLLTPSTPPKPATNAICVKFSTPFKNQVDFSVKSMQMCLSDILYDYY